MCAMSKYRLRNEKGHTVTTLTLAVIKSYLEWGGLHSMDICIRTTDPVITHKHFCVCFSESPLPPQIKDKAKELENGKLTKVSKMVHFFLTNPVRSSILDRVHALRQWPINEEEKLVVVFQIQG